MCGQERLQGEGSTGGQWRRPAEAEVSRSEFRPRGPEAEAREGVGCVPVEEMQALRASFPSSWDSAPWSVRVVPRELFHRDGVTLTERHVLVAPTHLANRHLLIAS